MNRRNGKVRRVLPESAMITCKEAETPASHAAARDQAEDVRNREKQTPRDHSSPVFGTKPRRSEFVPFTRAVVLRSMTKRRGKRLLMRGAISIPHS